MASGLYGVVGAVLGGVIVLFGGEALRPDGPAPAEIATVSALETKAEELNAALETAQAALAETASSAADAAAATASEAASALEARQSELAEAAAAREAEVAASLETLKAELATERTRVTRLNDELVARERERAAAVTAIREQVSALAAAVSATPGPGLGLIGAPAGDGGEAGAGETAAATPGPASAASDTRLALLEGGLRRLEARLNGLSAEALPTPDLTRIDQLETANRDVEKRLESLEETALSAVSDGAELGIAFANLSQALESGASYADELALVRKHAPDGTIIAPALADHAETRLPSYVALAEQLEEVSWDALDASAKARVQAGGGGVVDRLSGLFTFRPATPVSDASVDATLDRALERVKRRDAAGALADIATLDRRAAPDAEDAAHLDAAAARAAFDALAPWRERTAIRADAEAALEALRAKLLGGGDGDEASAAASTASDQGDR
ncbi:MAG: hypothetical protein AAF909_06275 [Pseudomonadota bacterium]